MRIVLFGPPGVGKGSQASMLVEKRGVTHISTGILLRRAIREETDLGLKAKEYVESGHLVPGALVRELANGALDGAGYDQFVLDGYPRTIEQANWLMSDLAAAGTSLSAVISLVVSDNVIVDRLSKRRINIRTGENYHLDFKPVPAGVPLEDVVQRKDDRPEAILHRLSVYRSETFPVVAFFRDRGLLHEISGEGSFSDVCDRILQVADAGS